VYEKGHMPLAETVWLGSSILTLIGFGALSCCCQQQQQQILQTDDDEPRRVCPNCGMENPREANNCGDCGFSFDTKNASNEG
jgi:ribosomal protein S27AE